MGPMCQAGAVTIHIFYKGKNGNARKFAEEMTAGGTADAIRREDGNEGYDYFLSLADPETVLLIDRWRDRGSLDAHHASPMMERISQLREKYDLHMTVERYVPEEKSDSDGDARFIRK